MGFWDNVGKVAKGVGRVALYAGEKACGAAKDYMEEINNVREEIVDHDMSDDEVMRMYRNSSGARKMAAMQELKDRGIL